MKKTLNKGGGGLGLPLIILIGAACMSLFVGKFPIVWRDIFADTMSRSVFFGLRLPRTAMALVAGVALGVGGATFQSVFQNPLASPDIIGVSSGASLGAAFGILFLGGGALATSVSAFLGGVLAVLAALTLSNLQRGRGIAGVVLAGIAINAMAQAALMLLKLSADPEKELAAIEFWIMGSLANVTAQKIAPSAVLVAVSLLGLFLLRRQILLLSLPADDSKMLGVNVKYMRIIILLLATMAVGATISVTGLIAFVGLLAPHIAKLITKESGLKTGVLSAITGGILLLFSDIIARSIGGGEAPVSVVTSLLGAPFLFYFMAKDGRKT